MQAVPEVWERRRGNLPTGAPGDMRWGLCRLSKGGRRLPGGAVTTSRSRRERRVAGVGVGVRRTSGRRGEWAHDAPRGGQGSQGVGEVAAVAWCAAAGRRRE